MEGFLGSHSVYRPNLNLMIQIAIGATLISGALLARTKRIVAHGVCQIAVLVLNLMMICFLMLPSF